MSDYFSTLVTESVTAEKQESSINWLRKAAYESEKANTDRVIKDAKALYTNRQRLGHIYLFRYVPLHRQTLPFYDRYPVVIMVEQKQDGFLGLNLHYLPLVFRAMLMDRLLTLKVGDGDNAKLRVTYEMLSNYSKLRYYKPCLKHYLNSQIRTKLVHVDEKEWEHALFLPLQQFLKTSQTNVYKDSLRQIRQIRTF